MSVDFMDAEQTKPPGIASTPNPCPAQLLGRLIRDDRGAA
jgi:hypothetical protein